MPSSKKMKTKTTKRPVSVVNKSKNKTNGSLSKNFKPKSNGESTVVSPQLGKQLAKRRHRKSKKVSPIAREDRGIMFIRHLPTGFFEDQLESYFKQFGAITRVRVVRSRKTGNSKGFAFVEFQIPEVAEIACNTMNNYLMFKKKLETVYIPPEEQKFNYFKTDVIKNIVNGEVKYISNDMIRKKQHVKKVNEIISKAEIKKKLAKNLNKVKSMERKYAKMGLKINPKILRSIAVHPQKKVLINKRVKKQENIKNDSIVADESDSPNEDDVIASEDDAESEDAVESEDEAESDDVIASEDDAESEDAVSSEDESESDGAAGSEDDDESEDAIDDNSDDSEIEPSSDESNDDNSIDCSNDIIKLPKYNLLKKKSSGGIEKKKQQVNLKTKYLKFAAQEMLKSKNNNSKMSFNVKGKK